MSDIRLVKKDSSDKLENIKFGISAAGVRKIEAEAKNYINTLQKYSDKVNRQEYFSSEDLKGYKAAMDGYINSNNRLRRLNKSFGKGYTEEEEKTWNDSMSSLQRGYTEISDYFSKYKTDKDYKDAVAAFKQRETMRAENQEELQAEIDKMTEAYEYWNKLAPFAPSNSTNNSEFSDFNPHTSTFNPADSQNFVNNFDTFDLPSTFKSTDEYVIPNGSPKTSNNKDKVAGLRDIVEQEWNDKYAGMTLGQLKEEINKKQDYLTQVRYLQTYDYITENDVSLEELKSHLKDEDPIAYTDPFTGKAVTWATLVEDKEYEQDIDAMYEKYSSLPDWAEKSTYVPKDLGDSILDENIQGEELLLDYIYGDDELRQRITTGRWTQASQYTFGNQASERLYDFGTYGYDSLNDKEKALFTYLKNEEAVNPEAYKDFRTFISDQTIKRHNVKELQEMYELGQEDAVLASIKSIDYNIVGGFEWLGNAITGDADKGSQYAAMSSSLRQGVSDATDWMIGNWDAFDFVYNTTMSMADSTVAMATMGKAGGIALGLSAAAQETNSALDRGMSKNQAFWSGLAAGTFEAFFETVSIGQFNALKTSFKSGGKAIAKNIAKSMLVNASEETLTEIANIIYDTIANADFSNYETMVRTYVMQGMSVEQAERQAKSDMRNQVVESMASGALMGFGFSFVGNTSAAINAARYGKYYYGFSQKSVYALTENGLAMPESSKAYKLAVKAEANLKSGKNLSGTALYNLATAIESEIKTKSKTRFSELGIDKKAAKELSPIVAKAVFGEKLSSAEHSTLNNSEIATQVVKELSADRANTIWKDAIKNNSVNFSVYSNKNTILHSESNDNIINTVGDDYVDEKENAKDIEKISQVDVLSNVSGESHRTDNESYANNALNELELTAILNYKSSASYIINDVLRNSENLSDVGTEFVKNMDDALIKMPTYQGTVYRNIAFDWFGGQEAYDAFLSEHKVGYVVNYLAFTSASIKEDGYLVDGRFAVSMVIESGNAKNVDGYGNNFESEVIFPRNSVFVVNNVKYNDKGQPIIHMTEVIKNDEGKHGQFYSKERSEVVQSLSKSQPRYSDLQDISEDNTTRCYDRKNYLQSVSEEGRGLKEFDYEEIEKLKENFEDRVESRLLELGIDNKTAKALSPIVAKAVFGEKLSSAEHSTLNNSEIATQVVKELSADKANTIWKDAIKSSRINNVDENNAVTEQGEALQSSATDVVDSVNNFNYNDNSIKEGEYSGIYQGRGLGSSDEETSEAVDSEKEEGVGGIYGETTLAFRRRTKETYGKYGRTVSHLNISVAYKAANVIDINSPAGVAYSVLKSKGYNVVYCDGPILINNNRYTVERTEAVTIFDGTIYISSNSTLNGESIALHEVVHIWQYGNNVEYSNYESVVLQEIDPMCEVYKKVASQINDNHYNGRYDIEDINSFEHIIRELTAYISQYVCTNPKFAREKFAGMFENWENVVQAAYKMNDELGFGDVIKEATTETQVAFLNSNETQTNEIDTDEFIKGLRGEDDSDSEVLQSNVDSVVDGDIVATQHNENSKLQSNENNNIINSVGDNFVNKEADNESVREIREKYFRKIGDDFQGGISETAETFSERTRRNSPEGSGKERLLLNEGKLIIAYTPVKDDNSPKHIFFKKLREYGIDIYYCDGVIETNVDGVTMVHNQAITTRGGKIFVSSVETVEFKSMMDHELVHWKMRMFSDSYFEYEDIVLRNLNRESNYYIAFCEELNLREYNNRYDINTIEGAIALNSEITAYVYQYVLNDSNFAENFFSKMFFDWHNVKNAVKRFNSKMEINTELFNQVGSYDESAFFAYKNKIENNTTEQGEVLQSATDGVVDSDSVAEVGDVQNDSNGAAAPSVVRGADGKQYFDDGSGDEHFGEHEISYLSESDVISSFDIKRMNDTIHVQEKVFETLLDEGFFEDFNERKTLVKNKSSGMIIEINKSGIRETFNYHNFTQMPHEIMMDKLLLIRNLPLIIRNGKIIEDNVKNIHSPKTSVSYAYIVQTVRINGVEKVATVVIRKSPQKNKFWTLQIDIKNNIGSTPAGISQNSITGLLTSNVNDSLSQKFKFVNIGNNFDGSGDNITKSNVVDDKVNNIGKKEYDKFFFKKPIKVSQKDWSKVNAARLQKYSHYSEGDIPDVDFFRIAEYNKINIAYRYYIRNYDKYNFEVISKIRIKEEKNNVETTNTNVNSNGVRHGAGSSGGRFAEHGQAIRSDDKLVEWSEESDKGRTFNNGNSDSGRRIDNRDMKTATSETEVASFNLEDSQTSESVNTNEFIESLYDGENKLRFSKEYVDSLLDSFGITKPGDYIHVQKCVMETLESEGFFTDKENRCTKVVNEASGMVVEINKSGIRETFNLDNFARLGIFKKMAKLGVLRSLPKIVTNARLIADDVLDEHSENANKKFAYFEEDLYIEKIPITVDFDKLETVLVIK